VLGSAFGSVWLRMAPDDRLELPATALVHINTAAGGSSSAISDHNNFVDYLLHASGVSASPLYRYSRSHQHAYAVTEGPPAANALFDRDAVWFRFMAFCFR